MTSTGSQQKSLFVCVGDLSADKHAAKLVRYLKANAPDLQIWGMGGTCMEREGVRLLYNLESLAAIGLVEVLRHLPRLAMVRQELLNRIISDKPDAVLLMDFGGFNLGLASLIRKHLKELPIVYFISPQVWGSRPWRINAIAKAVSKMLVIFPFEEAIYKRKGIEAKFVGHPLTLDFNPDENPKTKAEFCANLGLDPDKPIIGIFPGSRRQEIRNHTRPVLEAVDWLSKERPHYQFVFSSATKTMQDNFMQIAEKQGLARLVGKEIKTISSDSNDLLMRYADLLWTKSGTTTLEATMAAKPMLIYYRGSWISYFIIMLFKTVKYVGWPNLLHGDGIVPELIQLDCRAEQLVRYTRDWLDAPGLQRDVSSGLRVLKTHLGEGDFTANAADEILRVLEIPTSLPSSLNNQQIL